MTAQSASRVQWFLARLARLREYRALPLVAILAALFLELSIAVHLPAMLAFDSAVTRAIQGYRDPLLDRLAIAFTFVGNTRTLVAVGICVVLAFAAAGKPRTGLVGATVLLAIPLNVLIKHLIGRPRPAGDLVHVLLPAVGLSFPSGHAMASVAFYGFLALLAWIHIHRRPVRNLMAAAFGLIAVLICLSRIYVGAHWFSDVLGGATAGLILLYLFALLYKRVAVTERAPAPAALRPAPHV